jgi:predicted RNase H-like HicB family nuclease
MTKYAAIIERGGTSFGAYVPDLPGCVAAAETRAEVEKLIAEAIALHIESLREHGNPVPESSSVVEYVVEYIEPAVARIPPRWNKPA